MSSQEALQFIEANLDIETFIRQVQDHPALWNLADNDYTNRFERKRCWDEIAEFFSSGNDLSLDDKVKLKDILYKKWKYIRRQFTRDVQDQKSKSGEEAGKKVSYIYTHQLEFLRDTVMTQRITEKEDQVQEARSASSTSSDDRYFSLSLVQKLESLPQHLNTRCKIEIMECIEKYQTMRSEPQQPPMTNLPTNQSYPYYQYNTEQLQNLQQDRYQMHDQNQLQSTANCCEQQAESQQFPQLKHL